MSERIDHEEAYILHTQPWRETSLLVDAFSRRHGRVSLVARGARRPQSGIKARLLAFQPLWLSWFGKGSLFTLHAAEWQGGDLNLAGRALMCGFYLNELLLRLLPVGDAHEALFDRYRHTLRRLADGEPMEPVLRGFELDLLAELGYAHSLGHDASGGAVVAERQYRFTPEHGLHEDRQGTYAGKTLLALAGGDFSDPRTLAEGKQLMRVLIQHYLGDKPLHTRQLLRDMQQL